MTGHIRASVREFHQAVGEPRFADINRHERLALIALRIELMIEERKELDQAVDAFRQERTNENHQHLAKELADLLYIVAGTADLLGTPLEDPRSVVRVIPAFFAEGTVNERGRNVIKELSELGRLVDIDWDGWTLSGQIGEIGSDIQELSDALAVMANAYKIPLLSVFAEVHASNMTKIDPETGRLLRREDGKVLKGPQFRPADLSFLGSVA